MQQTTSSRDYLNTSAVGYMVNTLLGESSQRSIQALQATFLAKFPGSIWATPADALHITLLDWLAPLVEYDKEKDVLFDEIFAEYDVALGEALREISPIDVAFHGVVVSPSAIAIVADGRSTQVFNAIRQKFLDRIDLLPNTKLPPAIVHSTIVRFTGEVAVDE